MELASDYAFNVFEIRNNTHKYGPKNENKQSRICKDSQRQMISFAFRFYSNPRFNTKSQTNFKIIFLSRIWAG